MKIIIAPAKRMAEDWDSMALRSQPQFLDKTRRLYEKIRAMDRGELQKLLACNDKIAAQNYRRYQEMTEISQRTPALFAYQGIQYQYMGNTAFTDRQYDYLQDRLCILSGFYGLLRPFDGIVPYRLEMQAKLAVDGCKNLYEFWGTGLGGYLSRDNDLVIDLASEEYSKAARKGISPNVRWLTVRFGALHNGKLKEKGTQVKMARGAMVRELAERGAEKAEDLQDFSALGYRFDPERSDAGTYVFVKEDT
jgi:hypothetical protein